MDQLVAGPNKANSNRTDINKTDIFVFDRFVPAKPPTAPALLIGAKPADWLPGRAGVASYPEIASGNTRHAVLRDISLRDLYIEQGQYLQPPEDVSTAVLLRSSDDKVLALAHNGALRWVLLGFDVASSNFGLLAGFPLFLGNTINWLADEPEILREQPGMIGVPIDNARVYAMDGSEVPVLAADGRSFFNASQPGLYTALGSDRPLRVTVNLLERRISDINQTAIADATAADANEVVDQLPLGLSALLLLLAATLLFVEWLTYHRRITV